MKNVVGVLLMLLIVIAAACVGHVVTQSIEVQDQQILRTATSQTSLDSGGPDQNLIVARGGRLFGRLRARLRSGPIRSRVSERRNVRLNSRRAVRGGGCFGGVCAA